MTNGEKIKAVLKPREYEIKTYGDWVEIEIQKLGINFSCMLDFWNAEYKEPTTKNDLAVEKIVDVLGSYTDLDIPYKHKITEDILNTLTSVTPIRPKGHWMGDSYGYICSNCEHSLNDLAQSMDYISFSKPKYCPNCGADMRGVEDDKGRRD
jgi:hypothetical protein